jgi:hypothetical protein
VTREPCVLCGCDSDTRVALVRWREPEPDEMPFASLVRCRDHDACRRRVEATGNRWQVQDPKPGRVA